MRCYEQVRVSLALLSAVRPMNVNLVGVGAGYSYVVSGPTHQCYEDLTAMRALPDIQVLSPADHVCAAALFARCRDGAGPKYLRLDAQVLPALYEGAPPDLAHGFHVHRVGADVCLVATGFMVHTALEVAERLAGIGIRAGVVDLFDLTGFDAGAFCGVVRAYAGIVTMEEGFRGRGGLDALVFDLMARTGSRTPVHNIGVEPGYRFELGTRAELHEKVGIGADAATAGVRAFLRTLPAAVRRPPAGPAARGAAGRDLGHRVLALRQT
jgi:transketolase